MLIAGARVTNLVRFCDKTRLLERINPKGSIIAKDLKLIDKKNIQSVKEYLKKADKKHIP